MNKNLFFLIPKCKKPMHESEYRPISLCNVIFKIITKAIANRLEPILPDIVKENQSVFVPNRHIMDNALIAFDIFHCMKKEKTGKKRTMSLKVDIAKAYNIIEWPFLQRVLQHVGFPERMTKLIMNFVSIVSFSAKLNGFPFKNFNPIMVSDRESHSPYISLFCVLKLYLH